MKISSFWIASLAAVAWTVPGALPLSAAEPKPGEKTKHVLVIGMDGTRPDALAKANTPHLDKLIGEGAFTDTAQILGTRYQKNNTISGPGWSSILTGVWADKHGVHDNIFNGRNYELFPHFFKHLKRARPDALTVSLVSWEPIHEFILSEADIARYEPLPVSKNQTADLRKPANSLQINTRDGNWHHLLASRQEGIVRLYLDGQKIGELNTGDDQFDLGGDFLYLGRDTRSGETCFQGKLDDVRLWNRALTDAEAQTVAHATNAQTSLDRTGLLAEYRFDAGPSSQKESVLKETAGHRDGPFPAEAVSKKTGPNLVGDGHAGSSRALDFPERAGKGHGVRLPLTAPLRKITQGDFTIEARFATTDPGRGILLGNYSSKAAALNLELHEDNSVRVYIQPETITPSSALQREHERDGIIARKAVDILQKENPTAMFVYFHQTDATGHTIGFSPDVPEYVTAIENVDGHIGTLLNGLQSRPNYQNEDWLVIVCTDHGGINKTHSNGHEIPEIRTVFIVVSGPAAQVGKIESQAYLVDVAATALTHLTGPLDPKLQLDGRAVGLK